jgi:hypothetical protein
MDKNWLLAVVAVGILARVLNAKVRHEQNIVSQGPSQQEAVWLILPGK